MTMPNVPITAEFPIYDPGAVFADVLAAALVARGILPSIEHVVYGPGGAHENDPPAPRVCIDFADDFTVIRPLVGNTNHGLGLVVSMTDDEDVDYEGAARSVFQKRETMIMTLWARIPESGEEDPKDLMSAGAARLARLAMFELEARVLSVLHDEFNLSIPSGGITGKIARASEQDEQYGASCTLLIPFYTDVPGSEFLVKVSEQAPMEADMIAVTEDSEYLAATVHIPAS